MFDLLVTVNSTRRASLPLTMTNHYMKPGYLALDDAKPLNPRLENNRLLHFSAYVRLPV